MADKIRVRCEHCDDVVEFDHEYAGSVQECPGCGTYTDVPDSSTEPTDPEPLKFEEQVLVRMEETLDRWNTLADRFEKLLQRWEKIDPTAT